MATPNLAASLAETLRARAAKYRDFAGFHGEGTRMARLYLRDADAADREAYRWEAAHRQAVKDGDA